MKSHKVCYGVHCSHPQHDLDNVFYKIAQMQTPEETDAMKQAAKVVLSAFDDWYDGPGYFPSSFVATIIRLRRTLENK